jgi:N-methylhydantoinase A
MSGYRVSSDVGGTFTDVVVATPEGTLLLGKALTTPKGLLAGLIGAIGAASTQLSLGVRELLEKSDLFIYSTTQATNAILEGKTARTAFLVTEGFPDILVRREGGRLNPYDFTIANPPPYVPRHLTFEIPERIDSEAGIHTPLDIDRARAIVRKLAALKVEAVGVCLLWSTVNPTHELQLARLLDEELPGIPYTLSHQLNPIIREYRRASSTVIDASLKPLMQRHLREIQSGLREAGFGGELLAATSFGGVMHMDDLIARPVFSVKSGPSMAPVAGRVYAEAELGVKDVIVCDTGGTSFDVSLIRDGAVVFTRETWLGEQFTGHLTGLSSVDARSIGSGGGSIAWVDPGGLLRVGPQSAGAEPGPACYGRGGTKPTVTDAAVVLGYIDPERFLGGRMKLDRAAAERAIAQLAAELETDAHRAALGILHIADQAMVTAIREMTIAEGIDPRESLLLAGGGAAGLNAVPIARELGCARVLIPRTAGALSACGAQFSDIVTEFSASRFTDSREFALSGVNATLAGLQSEIDGFAEGLRSRDLGRMTTAFYVGARYANQSWELEVPLRSGSFSDVGQVRHLVDDFHRAHLRIFAVQHEGEVVEFVNWKARLVAELDKPKVEGRGAGKNARPLARRAFFDIVGEVEAPLHEGAALASGAEVIGPALIEEPTTTIVIHPGARCRVTALGNYLVEVGE